MEEGPADRGTAGAQISRLIVQLLKEFCGRGPVDAKTYYLDDHVLVILSGGFSQVERTLMAAGEGRVVTEHRAAFQALMRDRFVEAVENVTGREVISFMGANDSDSDALAEASVFLLRPGKAPAVE